MAAARGMPIPPPDEIPAELQYKLPPKAADGTEGNISSLTVPIVSRSPSYNSDNSQGSIPHSLPSPTSPIASGSSSSPLFRGRARTLAALTSKSNTQNDLTPREIMLPNDPFVNGQPIEAYLYKDAIECPICFLYYPPHLNTTRCCHQPICSECFVQIKRPDPHPPEHGEADPNATPGSDNGSADIQLVSEPSACPFCVQPEFGVTYTPPSFRRGLVYAANPNTRQPIYPASPVSSSSSLTPENGNQQTGRRRAASLSANDPAVVTTDRIRPDWAQKLANARAHAARRSAAATALHTAAYLMNSPSNGSESRNLLGRRGVLRRTDDGGAGTRTGSPALQAFAFLTERQRSNRQDSDSAEDAPSMLAPPRDSSRRNRIDDLEEMMMMEAIRMSLASEEERRKRAEKEAKKEAKRREKEAKKAEKSARKNGGDSNSGSSLALNARPTSSSGRAESSSSSSIVTGDEMSSPGKGKGVDRVSPAIAETASADSDSLHSGIVTAAPQLSITKTDLDQSSSAYQPSPTDPPKRSHLRHVSSASSSCASLVESTSGEHIGTGGPAAGNPSLEPMFNFRSLAAVIGDEDKHNTSAEHVENTVSEQHAESSTSHVPTESDSHNVNSSESDKVEIQSTTVPHDGGDNFASKELEANSVEITGTNGNTEAAS